MVSMSQQPFSRPGAIDLSALKRPAASGEGEAAGLGDLADVLGDRLHGERQPVVQPAGLVVAGVEPDDLVALTHQCFNQM